MEDQTPGGYKRSDGLARVARAMAYSFAGLAAAFRCEAAFRQEVLACALLAPLGLWLGETGVERALLLSGLFLVLIVELVNSAIEAVVDRISDARHPLSKQAKDIGSAAVFVAIIACLAIWILVLAG